MLEQIEREVEQFHQAREHQKIIDLITLLNEEDKDFETLNLLARAQINLGHSQKGFDILANSRDKGEYNPMWNYLMGCSLKELKSFEEALKYLKKAEKLGQADAILFSEIGWILGKLSKYNEALEYLKKAETLGKKDIWLFSELGKTLKKLKKYNEALEYLKKAETFGRNDFWIYLELGTILGELRLHTEALEYLKKAETFGKDSIELLSEIGWNLGAIKNYHQALEYFEKAKVLGRDDQWISKLIMWNLKKISESENYLKDTMIFVRGGKYLPTFFTEEREVADLEVCKYQTTNDMWNKLMVNNPSTWKVGRNPVETLTWWEALEYCNKLSELEGYKPVYIIENNRLLINHIDGTFSTPDKADFNKTVGYRLPTEIEWEWIARGGELAIESDSFNTIYSGSDDLNEVAWYHDNSDNQTHSVGTKKPNELGIFDCSGNVLEWCYDTPSLNDSLPKNSPYSFNESINDRRLKGGSWLNYKSLSKISDRLVANSSSRYSFYGFRVVRTIIKDEELENEQNITDNNSTNSNFTDENIINEQKQVNEQEIIDEQEKVNEQVEETNEILEIVEDNDENADEILEIVSEQEEDSDENFTIIFETSSDYRDDAQNLVEVTNAEEVDITIDEKDILDGIKEIDSLAIILANKIERLKRDYEKFRETIIFDNVKKIGPNTEQPEKRDYAFFKRGDEFKEIKLTEDKIIITVGIEGTKGINTIIAATEEIEGDETKFNQIINVFLENGYIETKKQEKFPKREDDMFEEKVNEIIFKEIEMKENIENLCVSTWAICYEEGPDKILDYLIKNKEKYKDINYFTFGNMNYEVCEISWIHQTNYSEFFNAFPHIKGLSLQGHRNLKIDKLNLSELEILEIQGSGLKNDIILNLTESTLPKLKKLNLYLGANEFGCTVTLSGIKTLLNDSNYTDLSELGLCNIDRNLCFEVLESIFSSKYASQIKVLDLSKSVMTDTEGEFIYNNLDRLTNIKYINLNYNFFSEHVINKLKNSNVEINLTDNRPMEYRNGRLWTKPFYTE